MTELELTERLLDWQDRLSDLGIGAFRIREVNISAESPTGNYANAAVLASSHYDNVEFWFRDDFLDEADDEEIDETIIHEWMHVAMRDIDAAVETAEAWMPSGTADMWRQNVDHEREGLIDRVARTVLNCYLSK